MKNCSLVNRIRSDGLTSTRVSPWSLVLTSSLVTLRTSVTYSPLTPKYSGAPPSLLSVREIDTRGSEPIVWNDVSSWK